MLQPPEREHRSEETHPGGRSNYAKGDQIGRCHERGIPSKGTMSTKTRKLKTVLLGELNVTLGGDRGQGEHYLTQKRKQGESSAQSAAETRLKRGWHGQSGNYT